MLDLLLMGNKEYREKVRDALIAGMPLLNLSEIARRVGWTQAAIAKFCRSGVGGEDKIEEIGRILCRMNLLDPAPEHQLADELRALADFLDAPGSEPVEKVTKFRQFVQFWQGGIEGFAAALQKEKQGDR